MIIYDYDDIKKDTPFEFYKDDRRDKSIKEISGKIKYNLHDKTEIIFAESADLNKVFFTLEFPLGYNLIEIINLDLNLFENAINQLLDLRVFKDKNMTIKKYSQDISEEDDIRALQAFDMFILNSDEPLLFPEKEYNYEFTSDIAGIRCALSDCFQSIASLHPYLLQEYDRKFNWVLACNDFLREYEAAKNPNPKEWKAFLANIFQIIYEIEGDMKIIENFKKLSDLCLNTDRNDEWNAMPLNMRLYIADKFFGLTKNPRSTDPPSITNTIHFNVKNKSRYIENIEKKYGYFYEERLPDSYDIKTLRDIYKGCGVTLEEETPLADFYNICFTSFINMVKTETYMKKCANCGLYFVPFKRSDALYCDRPAPQNSAKTCKRYGSDKQYQINLKNDETATKHRQVYMKLLMHVKRNPDMPKHAQKLETFKSLSNQWKLDVKNGVKSEQDHLKWLGTYK